MCCILFTILYYTYYLYETHQLFHIVETLYFTCVTGWREPIGDNLGMHGPRLIKWNKAYVYWTYVHCCWFMKHVCLVIILNSLYFTSWTLMKHVVYHIQTFNSSTCNGQSNHTPVFPPPVAVGIRPVFIEN